MVKRDHLLLGAPIKGPFLKPSHYCCPLPQETPWQITPSSPLGILSGAVLSQEKSSSGQGTGRAHLLQEGLMLSPQGIPLLGQVPNEDLLLPTLCQLPPVQDLALL